MGNKFKTAKEAILVAGAMKDVNPADVKDVIVKIIKIIKDLKK